MEIIDRILGCLFGQAIGDALGLGTEFMNRDEVGRHYPYGLTRYDRIIRDEHRCRWQPGAWTDDTEMMLCILRAFDGKGFDIEAVASNFKDWSEENPLGIGAHTYKVLAMRDYVNKPSDCARFWWEVSGRNSAANGAVMRTSVVGLAKENIERQAEEICQLTHFDPRCVGSCVIVSMIINSLVWKGVELSYEDIKEVGLRYSPEITEWINQAYDSSDIRKLDLDEPSSIGYTLRTLSAALWTYWHSSSFEEGLLAVVNEGGDADTNAAVACAILGAKFGYRSLPPYYVENLHGREKFYAEVSSFISDLTSEY